MTPEEKKATIRRGIAIGAGGDRIDAKRRLKRDIERHARRRAEREAQAKATTKINPAA